MKRPLVLFSGGLDSTALLENILKTGPCDTLYINGSQSSEKAKKELAARKSIIEYLNANSMHKVISDYTPGYSINLNSNGCRYSQPVSWLVGALGILNQDIHNGLYVGYVYDDGGFCRHIPTLENIWRDMQMVSKWDKPVPLHYPLIDTNKVDILNRIDPELLTKIWVCETPTSEGKACLKCNPCILLKQVMKRYEEIHKHSIMSKVLFTRQRRSNLTYEIAQEVAPLNIAVKWLGTYVGKTMTSAPAGDMK